MSGFAFVIAAGLLSVLSFVLGLLQRPCQFDQRPAQRAAAPLAVRESVAPDASGDVA